MVIMTKVTMVQIIYYEWNHGQRHTKGRVTFGATTLTDLKIW